jgi:seryl-tRNA synthetase
MLSINFIRQNRKKVEEAAKNKNRKVNIETLLKCDDEKADLDKEIQKLREERNTLAKLKITDEIKKKGREVKTKIKDKEEKIKKLEDTIHTLLSYIPNVPYDEVPIGKDTEGNQEIKKWGTVPSFDFTPKSHIELGKDLDIIDFDRGTKVSGFRGYFLKNGLALLHMAVMMYAFQKLSGKGYTPMIAPAIIKSFTLYGSGQFPWSEQDVYKLNDDDAYLAGTAEQPVTAYHSKEILVEKDLPKKYVAFSPCFRKEAGSYGKDTKGMYRLHEFWKIEQVIIGANDSNKSRELHEELLHNSEELLQDLGLPYRVLLMCTGDMGEPQVKKYDIETWMPSRNAYGETMSNSIMGDFQTRRLDIQYRKADGTKEYCYSFNNTALASPRILIALLENHQQKDGSVLIPKALQPFVGMSKISKN